MIAVSSKKLPPSNLPRNIDIAGIKYTIQSVAKDGDSSGNDGRVTSYSSKDIAGGFFVFDKVITSEKDALKLVKHQVSMRNPSTGAVKVIQAIKRDDQKPFMISEGYDQKINWSYFILGTYEKDAQVLRTRILVYPPTPEEVQRQSKYNVDKMIEEIINRTAFQ